MDNRNEIESQRQHSIEDDQYDSNDMTNILTRLEQITNTGSESKYFDFETFGFKITCLIVEFKHFRIESNFTREH